MKTKKTLYIMMAFMILSIMSFAQAADLSIDSINLDPAIVSAGDEVDIVLQYSDITNRESDYVGNPDYTFGVTLVGDDDVSRKYITILDSEGDDVSGTIYSGGKYNKVFRIKVATNAPTANYQLKLIGTWYKNGVALESTSSDKFMIPVKKEGIILNIANLITVPAEARPGDDYIIIEAFVENVGEKDAKSIELNVKLPNGLASSYSNNNRVSIGSLKPGDKKQVRFYVDAAEDIEPGIQNIRYDFDYMDLENNKYDKSVTLPLLLKSRPNIEVINYSGEGLAGRTGTLTVTIKNTGTESAESIDIRLLKQNSQPFDFDVRSDYVGELMPGEEGVAIFNFDIQSEAQIKEHDFKILIRSKGDSDEGDDNIYTYDRRAKFTVTGVAPNKIKYVGFGLIAIVALYIIGSFFKKKK